uniref:Uncharacterized protein n=1 Tax=Cacopsylla melanoneura TaxID=428564 RepID=A0A8D8WQK8_9HEMI
MCHTTRTSLHPKTSLPCFLCPMSFRIILFGIILPSVLPLCLLYLHYHNIQILILLLLLHLHYHTIQILQQELNVFLPLPLLPTFSLSSSSSHILFIFLPLPLLLLLLQRPHTLEIILLPLQFNCPLHLQLMIQREILPFHLFFFLLLLFYHNLSSHPSSHLLHMYLPPHHILPAILRLQVRRLSFLPCLR